jgi:hypothetical protein
LNFAEKYQVLVQLWKTQYKTATGGKKLTNSDFASILKISREHFQRVLASSEIDERAYEDLFSRFVLWHLATKRGVDQTKALNVLGNEDELARFIFNSSRIRVQPISLNEPEEVYPAQPQYPDFVTAVIENGETVYRPKSGQKPDYIMEVIDQEVEAFKSNLHKRLTGSEGAAGRDTSKVSKKGRMDLSLGKKEDLSTDPQLKSGQKGSSIKKNN